MKPDNAGLMAMKMLISMSDKTLIIIIGAFDISVIKNCSGQKYRAVAGPESQHVTGKFHFTEKGVSLLMRPSQYRHWEIYLQTS